MATQSPANAVKAYLTSLTNPNHESEKVKELEQQKATETDPLKVLKLIQAIEDEKNSTKLIEAFVEHAKEWAEAEGIGVKAFAELGVSTEVLRKAEFDVSGLQQQATKTNATQTTKRHRRKQQEKENDLKEMRKAINARKNPFTKNDIVDAVDNAHAAQDVNEVIKEGVESGAIEDMGPDPDRRTGSRGAAPNVYNKVRNL